MALTQVPIELSSTPGIVDNSNATAITIDSSENVGIGTTSPSVALQVSGQIKNNNGYLIDNGTNAGFLTVDGSNVNFGSSTAAKGLAFFTAASSQAMTIDSSGNLFLSSTGTAYLNKTINETTLPSTPANHVITLQPPTTTGRYGGGISWSEGTNTAASINAVDAGSGGALSLAFSTGSNSAIAERMRIDSSGNLLVGKTSSDLGATAGIELNGQYDVGYFTRSGDKPLVVNRLSSDGTIADFRKDGAAVGSIGVVSGDRMYFSTADGLGLQFDKDNNRIVPVAADGSTYNNNVSLGSSSLQFKDLYLSGGVNFNGSSGGINTANRSFLMDEYEIGTCTIGLNTSNGDASLSRQDNAIGYYQKTGDICTVQFYSGGLTFSAAGTGTARVTGLPFNSRGGTYNYGVCSVSHNTATTTDIQNGYTAPNNNFITLTQNHATASGIWRTSGVRYFMFSITYLTT